LRRKVIWTITFVGGLFFLAEFMLPAQLPGWLAGSDKAIENPLTRALPTVTNFTIVVGTMAFLLGPFNLARSHLATLFRKRKGWLESLVFFAFLIGAILIKGLYETDFGQWAHFDIAHNALIYGITMAFFASSMALLAFYLVSAAHRAFRLNSGEAGLMMVAAVVILLGQVPLGDWITQGLPEGMQLRAWAQWILACPNIGVQRAVLIGASGGAFAAGMRHWLGLGRRTTS